MKNKNLDNHDNWQTPPSLYKDLDDEFHFDHDPCPLNGTRGLVDDWGQRNFINPPYSRKLKEAFVKRAVEMSKKGKLCVLLLPVSTSTVLFHDFIKPNADEIRFLRGRVKFMGTNTKGEYVTNNLGMHDSMIVVIKAKWACSVSIEVQDVERSIANTLHR